MKILYYMGLYKISGDFGVAYHLRKGKDFTIGNRVYMGNRWGIMKTIEFPTEGGGGFLGISG